MGYERCWHDTANRGCDFNEDGCSCTCNKCPDNHISYHWRGQDGKCVSCPDGQETRFPEGQCGCYARPSYTDDSNARLGEPEVLQCCAPAQAYCNYKSFEDASCNTPTSIAGMSRFQDTTATNTILGTELFGTRWEPHGECISNAFGDNLRMYVDFSGPDPRLKGTVHSNSDCSDVGAAFDDIANGVDCHLAVGAGAQAAGVGGWKFECIYTHTGAKPPAFTGEKCPAWLNFAMTKCPEWLGQISIHLSHANIFV